MTELDVVVLTAVLTGQRGTRRNRRHREAFRDGADALIRHATYDPDQGDGACRPHNPAIPTRRTGSQPSSQHCGQPRTKSNELDRDDLESVALTRTSRSLAVWGSGVRVP